MSRTTPGGGGGGGGRADLTSSTIGNVSDSPIEDRPGRQRGSGPCRPLTTAALRSLSDVGMLCHRASLRCCASVLLQQRDSTPVVGVCQQHQEAASGRQNPELRPLLRPLVPHRGRDVCSALWNARMVGTRHGPLGEQRRPPLHQDITRHVSSSGNASRLTAVNERYLKPLTKLTYED